MPTPDSTQQAHADKWADLPTIECRRSMTDDDREFQSDLDYMRDLVAELHEHGTGEHLSRVAHQPTPEFDIDIYPEPWPDNVDRAADMLADWHNGNEPSRRQVRDHHGSVIREKVVPLLWLAAFTLLIGWTLAQAVTGGAK